MRHGLGESVVLQLTDSHDGLNYEIFIGNFSLTDNNDESTGDDKNGEIIDAAVRNFLESHMRQNIHSQEERVHTKVIIKGRYESQQIEITEDTDVDLALPKT